MNILQERIQIKGYTKNMFEWLPMGEEGKGHKGRKEEREREME